MMIISQLSARAWKCNSGSRTNTETKEREREKMKKSRDGISLVLSVATLVSHFVNFHTAPPFIYLGLQFNHYSTHIHIHTHI